MAAKNIISKLEKNPYIRAFAIVSVVLSALLTIGTFSQGVYEYAYSNYFIAKNISDTIKPLSAGQSIEYFKKILGSQIIQRKISDKYSELIFKYKTAFIQTVVNEDNEVVYWAITYCGNQPLEIKKPMFSMGGYVTAIHKNGDLESEPMLSQSLFLNKSTISSFYRKERGDFIYFISGATSNSFAYESLYLGNPGAYQTIFIGVNDICPLHGFGNLSIEKSTTEEIESFRKEVPVNTYGETSPMAGEDIVTLLNSAYSESSSTPYIDFGVDRIRARYFEQN